MGTTGQRQLSHHDGPDPQRSYVDFLTKNELTRQWCAFTG